MIWKSYLTTQSRQPAGLFGRLLMGRYLDRANARINQLVYDMLTPRPQDHVLEIGFGGADLLLRIAASLDEGRIEGLELSAEMLQRARRRASRLALAFSAESALREDGWMERGFSAYSKQRIVDACRAQGFAPDQLTSIERKPRGRVYAYCGVRS